jgi:hypothetical protein
MIEFIKEKCCIQKFSQSFASLVREESRIQTFSWGSADKENPAARPNMNSSPVSSKVFHLSCVSWPKVAWRPWFVQNCRVSHWVVESIRLQLTVIAVILSLVPCAFTPITRSPPGPSMSKWWTGVSSDSRSSSETSPLFLPSPLFGSQNLRTNLHCNCKIPVCSRTVQSLAEMRSSLLNCSAPAVHEKVSCGVNALMELSSKTTSDRSFTSRLCTMEEDEWCHRSRSAVESFGDAISHKVLGVGHCKIPNDPITPFYAN